MIKRIQLLWEGNSSVLFNLSFRILGLFFTFLFSYFLVKGIGAVEVGKYQISFALGSFIAVWIGFGGETFIIRELPRTIDLSKKITYVAVLTLLSIFLLVVSYFFIIFFWEDLFGKNYVIEVESLKLIMLIAFLICNCLFLNNVLQCYGLTNFSTPIITLLLPILNIFQFFMFSTVYYGNILFFVFTSYLICWFSLILVIYLSVLRRCSERVVLSPDSVKVYLLELVVSIKDRFSFWLVSLLAIVFSHMPIILISKELDASKIAYLVYSIRIASLVSFPLAAINSNIAHKISTCYQNNEIHKIKVIYFNGIKTMLLLSIVPIVVIMIFSEEIMKLYGSGFADHALLLKVLLIGELVNIACGSTGVTLSMTHKEKYNLISSLSIGIIFLATLPIISSSFGVYGVAILYSVRLAIWKLLGLFFVRRHVFSSLEG
ncbi:MATE family efflux transporter [Vibrio cyclitrophicus]|uniref:MATE family efflux transporter n=1 Tax=Vibrio cyclitrophicus TaxID=47951 RepID=UPI000C83ADCA|nr:MATE family efflux transporter [Vibrio cyclitrophicus]PMJ52660.1 hypothetical protein BCU19_20995 [Vibrio cyclitrophicus]